MNDLATRPAERKQPLYSKARHDEILRRNNRLAALVRAGNTLKDAARAVGLSSPAASQVVRLYGIEFKCGRPRHGGR
jgi:hypothetical protein